MKPLDLEVSEDASEEEIQEAIRQANEWAAAYRAQALSDGEEDCPLIRMNPELLRCLMTTMATLIRFGVTNTDKLAQIARTAAHYWDQYENLNERSAGLFNLSFASSGSTHMSCLVMIKAIQDAYNEAQPAETGAAVAYRDMKKKEFNQ